MSLINPVLPQKKTVVRASLFAVIAMLPVILLLLVTLQRGFEQISDGVAQIRARPETEAVSIHVTTAMSSLWLTPRLAQFWKAHGNVPVSQIVSDVPETRMRTDLKLLYGDLSQETGDCRLLFRDDIVALASPEFAARHRIAQVSDLADLPLIHFSAEWQRWTGWDDWSAALGYRGGLGGGLRVNNYSIALQAAQDGMGVVLGWEALTGALIRSGALVQVLEEAMEAPMVYYIKARPNAPARALLLRDWLVAGEG